MTSLDTTRPQACQAFLKIMHKLVFLVARRWETFFWASKWPTFLINGKFIMRDESFQTEHSRWQYFSVTNPQPLFRDIHKHSNRGWYNSKIIRSQIRPHAYNLWKQMVGAAQTHLPLDWKRNGARHSCISNRPHRTTRKSVKSGILVLKRPREIPTKSARR